MADRITLNRGDWFNRVQQTITGMRGFDAITVENFLSDNVPYIGAGSAVEVDGAVFEFTEDAPIYNYGLTLNNQNLYIKLVPSDAGLTAYFTEEAPVYDEYKRGLYKPNTSERYLSYGFEYNEAGGAPTYSEIQQVTVNYTPIVGMTNHNGNLITAIKTDTYNSDLGCYINIHHGTDTAVASSFRHPMWKDIRFMFVWNGDLYTVDKTTHEGDMAIHDGITASVKETRTTPFAFRAARIINNQMWAVEYSELVIFESTAMSEEEQRIDIGLNLIDFEWDGTNLVTLADDYKIRVHDGISDTVKMTLDVPTDIENPYHLTIVDTYYTGHTQYTSFGDPKNLIYRFSPAGYKTYYQPTLIFPNIKIYSTGKIENV